ncbi:MAG: cytochrome c family protein [Planctomycetes bacterium]|nr:cytochrome c family protein [Planctomycetota bacterium]
MRKSIVFFASAVLIAVCTLAVATAGDPPDKGNKYIGADKCKNCHEAKAKGSQYSTWKGTKHAKAYEGLGTEEAKKQGKEKGVDDPQTNEKCIKCHQTGYGEPAEKFAAGFDPKAGVQCESCHGPGGNHLKARMAAADEDEEGGLATIPDGEIVKAPKEEVCKKCHNEESPNYKPFCFKHFEEQIRHFDPRKKRTEAEIKAMHCAGECGVKHDK